jgi:CheY-like chemotaxis protein
MSIKVLIADDIDDVRVLLRMIIESETDMEVVAEASNGIQASLLATAHQPDLVISDMDMPVQDGLWAIERIRQTCVDTKIIMLSGFALYSMSEARAAGADACLDKSGNAFSSVVTTARDLLSAGPSDDAVEVAV